MIEVDVLNKDTDEWHYWWLNFRNYYIAQGIDMRNNAEVKRTLAKWNAIDKPQSTLFYFENEHDYLMFMLRWA